MSSDATSSFDRFVLHAITVGQRLARAWKGLSPKRRVAAYAAFGLFVGLFLPWYSQTVLAGRPVAPRSVSLSGWDAFSLVPTVVLLVSVGVLAILYRHGSGRGFRLPGGDGGAIMAAGGVTCVLVLIGMFDRPGASGPGQVTTATGVEWGIFIVLALAALLAYAGSQIRLAPFRERYTPPERPPADERYTIPGAAAGRRAHARLQAPALRPADAGVQPPRAGRHADQGLHPSPRRRGHGRAGDPEDRTAGRARGAAHDEDPASQAA